MGWNSWDCYEASVREEEVRRNADYMAKNLKPYGWEYVVVDIQWFEPTATSAEYNLNAKLEMDEYGSCLRKCLIIVEIGFRMLKKEVGQTVICYH